MSEHTNPASPKPPSVDRLSQLWRRVNDYKMVQWSVAYIALAYGIQHGVVLTGEAFEWPHLVQQISMLLLGLGLPIVMVCAWYHGERASRRISGPELTIIALLLVTSSLLLYVFVHPTERTTPALQQSSVAAARTAAASPKGAVSVVVLPFSNMSGDGSQEFFSDGMTEEITAALAKVPDLRVVARTSAFEFKGKNIAVDKIGQQLHATHLIEGSVRKAGNRLRITAQLIKADDGTHIWAENYDRELNDVFAIQEDIAQAIAASLRVPLGLQPGETLVSNRTADAESYQDYLRARALFRARNIKDAVAILERATARDPNYAPAWGLLAEAYQFIPVYAERVWGVPIEQARRVVQLSFAKAEMAAREAIRLDSKHASGYAALAYIQYTHGNWTEADNLFRQAFAFDSDDPDTQHLASLALIAEGRLKQALNMRKTLRTLEPFVPIYNVFMAVALQVNDQSNESIPILEAVPPRGGVGAQRDNYLALAYAAAGRYGLAADTILAIPPDQIVYPKPAVQEAAALIRKAPAKLSAPEPSPASESALSFVYAYIGAPDRLLDVQEYALEINHMSSLPFWIMWEPAYAPARKTERFKALMRKAGLVDYWRQKGWPDLCHPVGADDFACE